ncbi:LytTR family transcriptional regulator DNA-binding domain-containing protein [Ureibacillus aquaedulcis]|uniref:LytTR family transcriptional regulator DNA-binding domain-containing protein n=1 Tax=Ureibacillus aquaedulcis TaxID=3058421 RepID=A0ABT8GUU7_9BACL|nr:LytTR family transcriptional regulator DNA-binding domain-containing protein [Ureibacillus sp. BA0131]MDN4495188.1 LytTR family transcriptional regulator DNA-binding domain-containing protein [Ureibacillus sp. BA0131]
MTSNIAITIDSFAVEGNVISPSIEMQFEEGSIIGIYSDVAKLNFLTKQFSSNPLIHTEYRDNGFYNRLTINEYISFLKGLYSPSTEHGDLLTIFELADKKKARLHNLSSAEKQRLRLIHCFMNEKPIQVIEEPLQNLDEHSKRIVMNLLLSLKKEQKTVILLSNNMEEILFASDSVFRLEASGLQPLDVKEEETAALEKNDIIPFRFEKIPTKRNEKIILFNPPEIDYIESVEGQVSVYLSGETYPTSLTLNELEQKLTPFGFFRCHRSYIVNLQKVREIITWTRNSYSLSLHTSTETVVPLSKNKLVELKRIIGI